LSVNFNIDNDRHTFKVHLCGGIIFSTMCNQYGDYIYKSVVQFIDKRHDNWGEVILIIKGELNPKIKLDLNDSFFTLINKYNSHIF